jgi:tagatose-6-phosphate ketose/aldose isomerase
MFTVEKDKLEQMGAEITTREIRQQPELGRRPFTSIRRRKPR